MKAVVRYHIANYSGEIEVGCDPDDDNDVIIAKAKRYLRNRVGNFPFGYESWKVIDRY